jgi:arylsulfatase A-like enzyme
MHHRDPEQENIQFTRTALAMCKNIDWNVGRVVTKIEELGLSENTIIVYFADNNQTVGIGMVIRKEEKVTPKKVG